MDQLKKQRKPLKSKISRISNWLRDNSTQETDPLQFQLRHTELTNCYTKYDDLMDQIEELDEENTEERDREEIEEKYFSTLAGLQHKMEMLQPPSHQSSSTSPRLASAKVSINRSKFNIPSTVTLADPTYSVPGNIDLLLASDIYSELLSDGLIRLGKGLPVLQNTHLGYIMFGSLPPYALHKGIYSSQLSPTQSNVSLFVQSTSEEDKLDNIIRQFFEVEEVTPSVKISSSEDLAEQIFTETTQILPSGRFQVKLPLISETAHKMLGNSYNMARKRFISLENKLLKHENVYTQYKAFINEYVSLGHAKKVPLSLTNVHLENKYFLPHHSVIKEESLTTKLRVVFDGSMKSSSGYSLNDILLKGKTLQPELFDILLRFRLYTYVFTSDIQKMYRQVRIHPDHTFLQNILWRDSPEQDIECLELQTVTYGTKSASFQSTRCLMELAKTHQNKYPLASDALLTGCYVDDILYGANDTQTLLKAHNEITDLLNKTITLPRLELMGALLASKLTTKVVDIIKDKLPSITSINMWSDSEIVLAWLRSHHSRWNQFVANRVAQIQENSSHSHWRHVKSKDNPADILSRGMMPSNILNSTLWFHGPQFLQTFDLNLSEYSPKFNSNKLPEERKVVLHTRSAQFDFFAMLSERFSSFTKYVRTIAYVLRFANNARSGTQKLSGALEVSELQNAEMKIIKLLQNSCFSSEIADLKGNKIISNKSLLQFAPFLDKNEMLRVGGRLRYSEVTFDQKYPLLLPSKNHVVRLILKKEHLRLHHAGPQNTLSQVRLRYWPLNGLREIKRIVHECHVCFKFNAKPLAQIMSDLPKERLCSAQVFAHVGLDFGGPFLIKASKLRKSPLIKSYIALDKVKIRNPNKLTQMELEELAQVICNSDSEEELPKDDADTSSEEYVEETEQDSESEIESNDSHDDLEHVESSSYFIAKDKLTRWNKNPLKSKFSKVSAKNLVKIFPGVKQKARDIQNEVDAFMRIFTDEMIVYITINARIDTLRMLNHSL
ncbi:uncharacterized protein [Diabrotica undecimpunctata]|uniref:uncharacterized protein n=1 Tax=Diabrotica undecimpunctata TaxID=50387 RepID=UPI003B63C8CA